MLDPKDYRDVFGKTWVDKQEEPLLTLGKRSWTRHQLVSRVGVGNYRAVTILMDALQRMKVETLEQLWALEPTALAAVKGVGVTTLFVAMSLLAEDGKDPRGWYQAERTFSTLKHREERKKAELRRQKRRRPSTHLRAVS